MSRLILVCGLFLLLAGCAQRSMELPSLEAASGSGEANRLSKIAEPRIDRSIEICFGTNRGRLPDRAVSVGTDRERPIASFSSERTDQLTLGGALVNVPRERTRGQMPRVAQPLTVVEEQAVASANFYVAWASVLTADEFKIRVAGASARPTAFKGQVLIYVHGFNNGHEDALIAAAQLKADSHFHGPTLAFTWPSAGSPANYVSDVTSAQHAATHLKRFIDIVAEEHGQQSITILAHSMGARLLLDAFKELSYQNHSGSFPKLREVILAAPAIDWASFHQHMALLGRQGYRTTVYCNPHDKALVIAQSKLLESASLVGQCVGAQAKTIAHRSRVDFLNIGSFDGCERDDTACSHNVFARNKEIVGDWRALIKSRAEPTDRSSFWTRSLGAEPFPGAASYTYRP